MKVEFSREAEDTLYEYERLLKKKNNNKYVVSSKRRESKMRKFKQFLYSLGSKFDTLPICDKKKLGQRFGEQDEILDKGLKQTHYKDESGFIWMISLYQLNQTTIRIYIIKGGSAVDESLINIKIHNNLNN